MNNSTNNFINQTTGSQFQHTTTQINSSNNLIITHLIDGGNPFIETQSPANQNQTVSPQNTQFSDILFFGTPSWKK
ncbi:17674_t:CDS:2 [Cetraspora pellucida]|uniref:17674_t:CDS:1 n=1 Tax=Cetraspora pellucida TaxID=1433469 RepID=A0A9N9EXB6_9GLOM|nr:17674_t:CDS:2 [Cetraspora pellucida]